MRYENEPFCAVVCVRCESDTTNTSKKLFSGKRASDRNLKFKMKRKKLDKKKRARMLKFDDENKKRVNRA